MSISRKKKISSAFIALLLLSLIILVMIPSTTVHAQELGEFAVPVQVQTFGDAWEGEITFGLWNGSTTPFAPTVYNSYLVVMSANGSLHHLRQTTGINYVPVKSISKDTLMFQGEPVAATHFWNFTANVTMDFPNVYGHHDVEYNPVNNTFLNLRNYVRSVNGNQILFDQIVEEDESGNVFWTWDTYDYIPLSEADSFNLTTTVNGETVIDFTHANALQWDYNNNVVYLNLRHTNTFYKIDMNTGNVIWACGQFGNFTLLDAQGNPVTTLWYHSHSTRMVEPGVFVMFDNDFDNVTNPNNCISRMIEVTVDESNMTAWVSWSWDAPRQYWTPYFGKTDRLPNGDRIGVFGSNTHQFPQNQPWVGNDTGAVLVEVIPNGTVVRTWTFPPGWSIYRIDEVTSQSNVPTVPPIVVPELDNAAIVLFSVLTSIPVVLIKCGRHLSKNDDQVC